MDRRSHSMKHWVLFYIFRVGSTQHWQLDTVISGSQRAHWITCPRAGWLEFSLAPPKTHKQRSLVYNYLQNLGDLMWRPFHPCLPHFLFRCLGTLTALPKQDDGSCSLLRTDCIFHSSYVFSMDQSSKHSELYKQEKYTAEKRRLLDSFHCFSDPWNIVHVFEGKYI